MQDLDIVNLALGSLNLPLLGSLDDNNNTAKICKQKYETTRLRLLRKNNWGFAWDCVPLKQLAQESIDEEYKFVFALPENCVKVLQLSDKSRNRPLRGKLLCNVLNPKLEYVRDEKNVYEFDELFIECFQYLLTHEFALSFPCNRDDAQYFYALYEKSLGSAISTDAQENISALNREPNEFNFINSRW